MSVVELRGLQAGYGPLLALRGVDLAVERRECVALVGPNGSGKTTLLKTLAGLLAPRAGVALPLPRSHGGCGLCGRLT